MSRLILMLSLAAAASVPAAAQTEPPAKGTVVVRDAETGELRTPTAAEIRALQPPGASAARAAAAPPAIVSGPGGRRSVRLDDRHMVYSVVTRKADGSLGEHCVKGAQAAGQALSTPATQAEEGRHDDH